MYTTTASLGQTAERRPWKYVGYRGFCEFVDSDHDFFLLRRFGNLSVRILLALQDELCELEAQLQVLEDLLSDPAAEDIHNGSFREETSEARLALIREIDRKLRSFNELVLQYSELRARPRVARKDINSVSNWFHNHKNAIHPDEAAYINSRHDLFSVVSRNKTPLRRLLEVSPRFRLARLWRKPSSLDLGFLSFTTVAKPFETLGATAAYAAVLVVFLQVAT
ncbi:uncharacterized protein K460DRAFT_327258 [Cucurbitaria berberidis CBS 394.84]|uniref:DUF6594 domain-containing protein n=1 Tax=Cucurbitaria berberidis CBS 394.84 TaxID=1168544 RepID=A0A9P4GSD7_9PLEO|nr:uncharacterized protein K460DRAFT_327258 [Cucurbitaria berberidis CBS 394.84]KAF1850419.1 hypothetical protein K460DRAFT_327258 [Cucurbitaria berberidis CBS 394.84]